MTPGEYKSMVDCALEQSFRAALDLPYGGLAEAMRYSLLAGGKRIRPMLVLEFSRICGGLVKRFFVSSVLRTGGNDLLCVIFYLIQFGDLGIRRDCSLIKCGPFDIQDEVLRVQFLAAVHKGHFENYFPRRCSHLHIAFERCNIIHEFTIGRVTVSVRLGTPDPHRCSGRNRKVSPCGYQRGFYLKVTVVLAYIQLRGHSTGRHVQFDFISHHCTHIQFSNQFCGTGSQ